MRRDTRRAAVALAITNSGSSPSPWSGECECQLSTRPHSSHYGWGYSPAQRIVMPSPASATSAQCFEPVILCVPCSLAPFFLDLHARHSSIPSSSLRTALS